MATYTSDTTITSNLPDGETINIGGSNITVTIDASVFIPTMKYGAIVNTGTGTLHVKNDTNSMLIIEMNAITNDIRTENNGKFIIDGGWIEVMTSDGSPGQTIDFNLIGDNNDSIDQPTAVWVETTPGGELAPYLNLGDSTGADTYTFPLTFVGDGVGNTGYGGIAGDFDRGRFFEFERASRIATFGDGVNGYIPPAGCKVFFANVHLTCPHVAGTSFTTRSTYDTTSNGTHRFNKVNHGFWYPLHSVAYEVDYNYVSADFMQIIDTDSILKLNNIAVSPMTTHSSPSTSTMINITDFQGVGSEFSNIYVAAAIDQLASTSVRTLGNIYGEGNVKCENIWGMWVDKRNSTNASAHSGLNLYRYYDATIKGVTMINGGVQLQTYRCSFENYLYYGTPFVPQGTTFPNKFRNYLLTQLGEFTKHISGALNDQSLPPYYGMYSSNLLSAGNEFYEYNLVNRNYDFYLTTSSYIYLTYSDRDVVKNCVCDINFVAPSMQVDAYNLTCDNVRGLVRAGGAMRKDSILNMVSMSTNGLTTSFGASIFARQNANSAIPNEGGLQVWVGPPVTEGDYEYSFTGATSYFDNLKTLYLEAGAECIVANRVPVRGITAFQDAVAYEGGGLDTITELKIEAEMVKASQSFTGNYTELVWDGNGKNFYTTLQSMLDNLVGYNSNNGFNIRFRFTNIQTSGINTLVVWDFPCFIDTNYKANDAYVTIEGGTVTDQYEMRLKSDTSVLFSWEGVGRFDFPVGNLVGQEVYFVRYILSDGTYDRAASNKPFPIALQYGSNGIIKLYVGDEIQVASTDPVSIWSYDNRTLTEGFTTADRDQLNKGLTTGKFLALK